MFCACLAAISIVLSIALLAVRLGGFDLPRTWLATAGGHGTCRCVQGPGRAGGGAQDRWAERDAYWPKCQHAGLLLTVGANVDHISVTDHICECGCCDSDADGILQTAEVECAGENVISAIHNQHVTHDLVGTSTAATQQTVSDSAGKRLDAGWCGGSLQTAELAPAHLTSASSSLPGWPTTQ